VKCDIIVTAPVTVMNIYLTLMLME